VYAVLSIAYGIKLFLFIEKDYIWVKASGLVLIYFVFHSTIRGFTVRGLINSRKEMQMFHEVSYMDAVD
jgi:hypothetical protein